MSYPADIHKLARNGLIEELDKKLNVGDISKSSSLVSVTDKHKRTPLHLAAFFGHSETVAKLLEYKANIHAGAVDGFTALHFAAQNGHLEVCKVLVAAKANIDRATDRGVRSPLHLAAFKNKLDVMEYLIRRKANTSRKNSDGKTALELVADDDARGRLEKVIEEIEERKKRKNDSETIAEEEMESKLPKLEDS
jgi:ankyrin repeat protein